MEKGGVTVTCPCGYAFQVAASDAEGAVSCPACRRLFKPENPVQDEETPPASMGQILLEKGWVTPEQLQAALRKKAEALEGGKTVRLGEVLVEMGILTAAQAQEALGLQDTVRMRCPSCGKTYNVKGSKAGTEAVCRNCRVALVTASGPVNLKVDDTTVCPPRRPAGETLDESLVNLIPGYRLLKRLGYGGMGAVFQARQESLNRLVAVKLLPPEFGNDAGHVRRFLQEARSAAKVSHENIVGAVDAGEAGGRYYFIMEYVPGETVFKLIRKKGRLPEARALDIARQVAKGLRHAFNNGLIHRDIKPKNLIVTPEGTVKICDFGLAREIASEDGLTKGGIVITSPAYASPEQCRGAADVDHRADMYALGVTLYEMLTGKRPFEADSAAEMLSCQVSKQPPPPRSINPSISPGAENLIMRLLQKRPDDRFKDYDELIAAMDALLAAAPTAAPRAAAKPAPRRPQWPWIAVGGLAAAAGILLIALISVSGRKHRPAAEEETGATEAPATAADPNMEALYKDACELQARAEGDPSRYDAVRSRWKELEARFRGKPGHERFAAALVEFDAKVNAEARAAAKLARDEAEREIKAGRPLEAFRILKEFQPGYSRTEAGAALAGRRLEFQKALDLLEAQAEPLSREGLWDTLGNWLEQVPAEYRSMRPRLLLYLATVYQRHGRHDEAIRLLSGIIEAFQAQGQHNLQAQALMRRSAALQAKGALQMAVRDSREALLLAQKHCPPTVQAEARIHLGRTYAKQGKYPRAEREFRLALESYQEQGDLFQLSHIHKLLGTVYVELGNFSRATTHLELARQGWKKLGNQSELAATLNNMAWLYYEQGRLEDADPLARESIGLASAANSKRDEAYSLWTLADIQREQEAYGAALESYQRALALARECMETPLVSSCTIGMGETYRLMGDTARAKSLLKEGMDFAYSLGQDFELGMAFMGLGVMECESQDYEQSLVFLLRACTLLARAKQKRNLARARFLLAHTYFQSRKYTDALEQLEAVAELCGELGHDRCRVPDARRAVLMVQYAAIQAKHKDFFARLRDQASLRPSEAPAQVASAPAPRPPKVEVQTFGPLRILLDGTHLLSTAWGSAKAREMFLFMLYNRQPLHKEKIVESLWPQISSAKANSNFHSTLHRMKSALYPNCVDRDGELYQLNPGWSYWLDAHEFERLLQEAEQLSAEEAAEKERLLMAAIDLYKGPFLADTDAEWANAARAGLEFKFWKAVNLLAEQLKARGELRQSITLLEKALAIDELQEDVYYKVMDLYLELGDTAAADCRKSFAMRSFLRTF